MKKKIERRSAAEIRNEEENARMDNFRAVGLAEGWMEGSEDEVIEAWQYLVDTGLAWSLQGFFGRTASALIDKGIIQAA